MPPRTWPRPRPCQPPGTWTHPHLRPRQPHWTRPQMWGWAGWRRGRWGGKPEGGKPLLQALISTQDEVAKFHCQPRPTHTLQARSHPGWGWQGPTTVFIIFTLSRAGQSSRAVNGEDSQWGQVLRSCDVAPSLLIYVVIFKVIPCLLQNKYTLTISRKGSKKYSCHFEFKVQWRVVRGFSLIVDLVNSTGKRIIIWHASGQRFDAPKHTLGISMLCFGWCVTLLSCVLHLFSVCVCRLLSVPPYIAL